LREASSFPSERDEDPGDDALKFLTALRFDAPLLEGAVGG
jgi:hypothetical protein